MTSPMTDPTTGDHAILAPGRAARDAAGDPCPFCPGNEAATPPELARRRAADGAWTVRVVPNRFPIVAAPHGWHELVVESPRHDWDYPEATSAELGDVWQVVRARHRAHADEAAAIVTFRNHGARAGASRVHPHAQIVGLVEPPERLREMWRRALAHRTRTGRSLYGDLAGAALTDGRVVRDAGAAVALVPPAPAAYETWVVPTGAAAGDFAAATDTELGACARLLRALTGAVRVIDGTAAYRLLMYSAPSWSRGFVWHFRLVPTTTEPGGFEAATGLSVTTMPAREAARTLRASINVAAHTPTHAPGSG